MRAKPILIGAGAVAAVLVGVALYAASRIDTADVVRLAAEKVLAQTGRELKVDGKVGVSVSFEPTISLEGVRFQNAPWGSRPDMVIVRRVDVGIALIPLLSGKVDIRGLTLIEPDVLLETDAKGTGNWAFDPPAGEAKPSNDESKALPIDIHHAEVENGVITYRSAKEKSEKKLELASLQGSTAGGKITLTGIGRLNAESIEIAAKVDQRASPTAVDVTLKSSGAELTANTSPASGTDSADATSAQFNLVVSDWNRLAKLIGTAPISLPALKAEGKFTTTARTTSIEGLKATLGKSSFGGRVLVDRTKEAPSLDVELDASIVDLAELLGPDKKENPKDGRIFSAEPLPVAALTAIDGKLSARIARLALRDGKAVDNVEVQARATRGRIVADPVRLHIEGKLLSMRTTLDASSGKTLDVDLAVNGNGISLGALGALMNVSGTPEGSPTDLDIRFNGRGDSTRALMANANADVRIVVGPGRLRNRAIDWGADVTELLNAVNPARKSEPYTELRCAVVRLPIRQGVARIDNSIAAETSKVTVIAAGVIDFRNETVDLGVRPKAATGLGVGLGGLASLGRLRGSLANPRVQLDMSGTAQAAAQLGLAAATGGLSLLAGGLLSSSVPDNACQAALTGASARTAAKPAQDAPGVVDGLVGGIRKLFGR
jgi:uncharacterized protein involved in outer membrane biogenesis